MAFSIGKFNLFKKAAGSADQFDRAMQTGFGKVELQQFMKDAGSLGSAQKMRDTTAEGFGPQHESVSVDKDALAKANSLNASQDTSFFNRKFNTGENRLTQEFSQDQVKGFIKAFASRQDEVFRRRAQPGISQTRLT